jgi:addiction module HigA family antidote
MRERKRPPVHPGRILKSHYLEPLDISVTALATALCVSRKTASKVINEHGSITPVMALRLSRAFDTTPHLWLNLQRNYDLWYAAQETEEWQCVQAIG